MRRLAVSAIAGLVAFAGAAAADGENAGDFDYYVLALSWNASWCALEGDARGADQCDARHDLGFTLHGLWPQNERGWPEYCRTPARDPARKESAAMADIMGSAGLAWYQWKKHGRCSGLSAPDYFALARSAYESVNRPEIFRRLPRDMELPAKVVEDAFTEANPDLYAGAVTVTCGDGFVREVRVCLSRDMTPRACAPDAARDCTMRAARMPRMR